MNDLIWIGNTLYPRWFVYLIIILAVVIVSGTFTAILYWISKP